MHTLNDVALTLNELGKHEQDDLIKSAMLVAEKNQYQVIEELSLIINQP